MLESESQKLLMFSVARLVFFCNLDENSTEDESNSDNNNNNDNGGDGGGTTAFSNPRNSKKATFFSDNFSDLSGATISMANRRLEEVYGDYVYDNPGTHLHGGIG